MANDDPHAAGVPNAGPMLRAPQYAAPSSPLPVPFWRRRWVRIAATTVFILLPLIAYFFYEAVKSVPPRTSITIGPGGGMHEKVERGLAAQLTEELKANIRTAASSGSLENFRRMQVGKVDFTIYQTGTEKTIGPIQFEQLDVAPADKRLSQDELPASWRDSDWGQLDKNGDKTLDLAEFQHRDSIRFVANLFSEVIHILVRQDSSIQDATELRGKRVAVGTPLSGDYAMSLVLLQHLAIDPDDITQRQLAFLDIGEALVSEAPDEAIDAAILSAALGAPQVTELVEKTGCRIIPVPRVEALATLQVLLTPAIIPAGLYHRKSGEPSFVPHENIETVAARAQLLAHKDVDPRLVRRVTRVVLSGVFQQRCRLTELYTQDPESRRLFAQTRPEFPIHEGAKAFYEPEEFDAGIFEGWEALYSLIASFLLAAFVLARWIAKRREKIRGHRLDDYLGKLLDIELRQLDLDSVERRDDSQSLQTLLDEVTVLRQRALGEFSAHDLNDDPAQACFLQMCHYVSEKINAKLLRQRLDQRFVELCEVLGKSS